MNKLLLPDTLPIGYLERQKNDYKIISFMVPSSANTKELNNMKTHTYNKCDISQATHFRLNNKLYKMHDEARICHQCLQLRLEFDRWADFDFKELNLLGIEPVLEIKRKPLEFEAEVEFIVTGQGDNHGHSYDRGYYSLKPLNQSFIINKESRYKCVEILPED